MRVICAAICPLLLLTGFIIGITHIDQTISYNKGMNVVLDGLTGKFSNIIPADYKKKALQSNGVQPERRCL